MTAVAESPGGSPRACDRGLSLLAVVPCDDASCAWDPADPSLGVRLIPSGDLAALVLSAPPAGSASDPAHLAARHSEVHRALLRGDVLPAPVGIRFDSSEEVREFLSTARGSLWSALERVRSRWEFRLHLRVAEAGFSEKLALDLATHIYAELRRSSAAALTLRTSPDRVLSAAFLVDRGGSAAFQDRLEVLRRLNSALALDLTGPWPPYDFVQMGR